MRDHNDLKREALKPYKQCRFFENLLIVFLLLFLIAGIIR